MSSLNESPEVVHTVNLTSMQRDIARDNQENRSDESKERDKVWPAQKRKQSDDAVRNLPHQSYEKLEHEK